MVLHRGISRLASKKFCTCSLGLVEPTHVTTKGEGEVGTLDYRVFFQVDGANISPWHKIPLYSTKREGYLNFVCEIPRQTTAKYECATKESLNPIKQDVKNKKVRNYPIKIEWNYGMLPQTWEDPTHANTDCNGAWGDNDPLDVVEIGDRTAKVGEVYEVKPISAYAMIDEGELDWKVVCIAADDPRAELVNDVEDLEVHFPGELSRILEWFRNYKIPDGKPPNVFELDEKPMDRTYTMGVVAQTYTFYSGLLHLHRNNLLKEGDAKLDLTIDGAPPPCPLHAGSPDALERLESLKEALQEAADKIPEDEVVTEGDVVIESELPEYVRNNLEKSLSHKEIKSLLQIGLSRSSSLRTRDIGDLGSPHSKPSSPLSRTWT